MMMSIISDQNPVQYNHCSKNRETEVCQGNLRCACSTDSAINLSFVQKQFGSHTEINKQGSTEARKLLKEGYQTYYN